MANEYEPAKELLPYLQRADELQKHQPLISYYCRLYAMERGVRIPQSERTKNTNALLVSLLQKLEKDKKSLILGADDNLHLEGFALTVFAKADKQDRAGRADLSTAKTFYASSIFFEILNQFGKLQPDLEQKQKYAAWKAADIRKALKEGKKPQSGPPMADKDRNHVLQDRSNLDIRPSQKFDESTQVFKEVDHQDFSNNPLAQSHIDEYPSDDDDHSPLHYVASGSATSATKTSGSARSATKTSSSAMSATKISGSATSATKTSSSAMSATKTSGSAMSATKTSGSAMSATKTSEFAATSSLQAYETYDSSYQPSPDIITEAHNAAKFAVGALAFDDVSIAVDFLKRSLDLLTNPSASIP